MIKGKKVLCILAVMCAMMSLFPVRGFAMGDRTKELCDLIKAGDNEKAIEYLQQMKDPDVHTGGLLLFATLFEAEVTTPLNAACESANAQMITYLLENGASADYAPGRMAYPLETFCSGGTDAGTDTLKELLDHGADPNVYRYRPALFRIAETLRHRSEETFGTGVDMVLLLLENGADWQNPGDGYTILHFAVLQRDTLLLEKLLEMEESANWLTAENDAGETPLSLARAEGQEECAQLLEAAAETGKK